jgi:Protein of unknown function (DUF1573)
MKTTIAVLFLMISTSFAALCGNDGKVNSDPKTTIKWEAKVFDFGKIELRKDAKHEFTFINLSEQPVVLKNVKSSCGCTVTDYDRKPILPGKEGSVSVTYDAKRTGPFKKTVTIVLGNGEKYFLSIKGEVAKK